MNPMKEALKKRKQQSINLTIVLDSGGKKPEIHADPKPELEIESIEPDDENKLEIEPVPENGMMDVKKHLMERARLAAMGKPKF